MTKNFCDICGEPADKEDVGATIQIPDKKWSGFKEFYTGSFTPWVSVNISFGLGNFKDDNRKTPDLCRDCKITLLGAVLERFDNQTIT